MANYTISITSESEYVGPPLYVIYSTYMSPPSPSSTMQVGDTLTITYTKNAGGQSYVTIEGLDSSIWNTSANTQLNDGDSLVLTATGAGTDQIIANFPSSNFQDHNRNVTVEAAAPTVTAPTVNDTMSTHVVAGTTSATTTVDINLTSNGSGGTLEYNVSTTTTVPTTGWTTGNPSVTRGTAYYLWARQDASHYDRSASTLTIPYISPDTSITATWPAGSLASSATTFTVGIANGSSATTYSVRTGSYSGTVVGSRIGDGNISVSDTPAAGASKTYYLTGRVTTASGGSGTASSIETASVTKASEGSSSSEGGGTADYGVEIFDSAGVKTMSVGDTLGFISATATTGAISNSSSSGTLNLIAIGARVGDIPFIPVTSNSTHSLTCTIPSDNNLTVTYDLVKSSSSGTTTYSIYIINKGD